MTLSTNSSLLQPSDSFRRNREYMTGLLVILYKVTEIIS